MIWIIVPHEKVTDSFAKLCRYLEVDLANIFAGPDTVAVDRFIEAILARKVAAPKRRQEAGWSSRPASGILFQDGVGDDTCAQRRHASYSSSSTSRCIGTRQHRAIRRRLVELQCSKTVNRVGKVRTERTSAINRQKICGWQRKRQGLCNRYLKTSGEAKLRVVLPSIGHETDASESQDHHRPGGGLGDGCLYASNKQLRDLDVASCLIKANRTHNDGK